MRFFFSKGALIAGNHCEWLQMLLKPPRTRPAIALRRLITGTMQRYTTDGNMTGSRVITGDTTRIALSR